MDKQYQPTLTEVQDWVLKLYNTCEQTITKAERLEQHKYAVMVQRPQDKKFLVKMLDESSQIATGRYSPNVSRLSLTSTVSPNF